MTHAISIPDSLITWYLHMTSVEQFIPAPLDSNLVIMAMQQPDLSFYRFLYKTVGEDWRWRDRLYMSNDELLAALSKPGTSVHVIYEKGVPAGYIELVQQDKNTEVNYFGLRPQFTGRGLGKHLLSWGLARAWEDGAQRIWVHTCNLDAPAALQNYLRRGFSIYETIEQPMPDRYKGALSTELAAIS